MEQLRSRFPQFTPMDEVLFNLYYCYNKNGETAKAAAIKKLMEEKFSASNLTTIVTTGKDPKSTTAKSEATKHTKEFMTCLLKVISNRQIANKKLQIVFMEKIIGHPSCYILRPSIISNNGKTAVLF